ncbi:DNA-processing protein DprA [Asticcacaulis taihuensis]|uniref:DNA processing protein n=1 Tax=Asticcacaulis taihuensis TaxID=260084 RepID=A0A1G4QSK9_9CAUL|nr:DNA-processing protein DprA [Asticcacaulis taihuensis]SCW47624.1 DNA processing protein [Asticcacaulis taihuensis]
MGFDRIAAAADEPERIARLRLARTQRIGPVNFAQLMQRFGTAIRALEELPHVVRRTGGSLTPYPLAKLDEELARADAAGARLIVLGDADYPALLKQIDAAPPVLWTLGPLKPRQKAIGIVGARNASAAGQKIAQTLAHDLGEAGFHVISGLARGVDTRAHEMSVKTGTIGVLGGGVDDIYPPDNRGLYEQIRAHGLLVSESPVGHRATASDFPRRNRIISGLSLGTVVVEAELRSGSLITARLAAEQNREVFAVPGSPLDPRCRGTNDLLRQGANLCEGAEDIIRVLEAQMGFNAPEASEPDSALPEITLPPQSEDDIARVSRSLLDLVSETPVHRDDLLRLCGAQTWIGLAALSELEVAGRFTVSDGGFYSHS